MPTIRKTLGLAGFPKRDESVHDAFGTGHSSTSISAGLGKIILNIKHFMKHVHTSKNLKRLDNKPQCSQFLLQKIVGMAVARDILGKNNSVISVIGDGAMTAGQAYEALNNAGFLDCNMIVILNDNKQVSLPTATVDGPATPVGALSSTLAKIQASTEFRKLREAAKVYFSNFSYKKELMVSFLVSNFIRPWHLTPILFDKDHYKANRRTDAPGCGKGR